ncbi:hypothetical protein IE53DRAFT_122024 [Violaceomyces palustris]|uniref:Uncharacterized protein n=1 Tax=Violaceomyces palustris TaxID=1673888 RepID=A0ACD0NVV4_9BASI|nr:hypothetical protein IE53DRAFT_122024 [Violaceomyces palustris]
MNRSARSHRSTKVPNVKLRPAIPDSAALSTSSKRQRHRNSLQDNREDDQHFRSLRDHGIEDGAHDEADFVGPSAKPLAGAVISMTGIGELKPTLAKHASQMGARVEGNLTEDVTHLVARTPGSEKYRCALSLGMHIVRPDWILQMRERWLQGEDVDPQKLQEQHRLKALEGLTISFSALPSDQRRALKALAQSLGATVSETLYFNGTVSHLVSGSSDPNQSQSIKHYNNFIARGMSGRMGKQEAAAMEMKVVRPEWIYDSSELGGCMDEETYSIFKPPPTDEWRRNAISTWSKKIPSPFVGYHTTACEPSRKRAKLDSIPATVDGPWNSAMVPAQDEEEMRLQVGRKHLEKVGGTLNNVLAQIVARQSPAIQPKPLNPEGQGGEKERRIGSSSSLRTSGGLSGISREASFASKPSNPEPSRVAATSSGGRHTVAKRKADAAREGVFSGLRIRADAGDDQKNVILSRVLSEAGAIVVAVSDERTADYHIVTFPSRIAPRSSEREKSREVMVNHHWVELCIYYESLTEPDRYFASHPPVAPLPLSRAQGLKVVVLGLPKDGPEYHHARSILQAAGCEVQETIEPQATALIICADDRHLTLQEAKEAKDARIPLTDLSFVEKILKEGRVDVPCKSPSSGRSLVDVGRGSREDPSLGSTSFAGTRSSQRLGANSVNPGQSEGPGVDITNGSKRVCSDQSVESEKAGAKVREDSDKGDNRAGEDESTAFEEETRADEDDVPPLSGLIISFSRSVQSWGNVGALERRCLRLGAKFQQAIDGKVTHLLHRGTVTARETKELAKKHLLVHPSWLEKCEEEGTRLDERLFPPSLDPNKSLAASVIAIPASQIRSARQESQEAIEAKHGQDGRGDSRPASTLFRPSQDAIAAIANARPWHRSLSASSARIQLIQNEASHAGGALQDGSEAGRKQDSTIQAASHPSRGRSASPIGSLRWREMEEEQDQQDDQGALDHGPDPELTFPIVEKAANAAAGAQVTTEGVGEEDPGAERNGATRTSQSNETDKQKKSKVATADEVLALLRDRALENNARRRGKQPPRNRNKRRSEGVEGQNVRFEERCRDGGGVGFNASRRNGASVLPISKRGSGSAEGGGRRSFDVDDYAERVLALQAEKEEALGFSLGGGGGGGGAIGNGIGSGSTAASGLNGFGVGATGVTQNQSLFDASLRVVYDDPAARRERKRLLELVGGGCVAGAKVVGDGSGTRTFPGGEERREGDDEEEEEVEDQTLPAESRRGLNGGEGEGGGGGGGERNEDGGTESVGKERRVAPPRRAAAAAASSRKSESPTKRILARRQPGTRR